jgi:transaldolase|tara:strand:+ start:327 stop:974 length:648 start_codon:yes stop_codon:yes gene_type:complete
MKIFLDTADYDAISMRYDTGLLDGVTTNPSLIKKSGEDPYEAIKTISESFPTLQSISAEVVADLACDMVEQAKPFMELDNVTIKVPCTVEGLRACRQLRDLGATVNVTLIFSAAQAVLAAKAGATYVSPFVGRLTDNGFDGLDLIKTIYDIYVKDGCRTEILAASVRSPEVVALCYREGSDIVTMPPGVFDRMYESVLTREGLAIFQKDWDSINK